MSGPKRWYNERMLGVVTLAERHRRKLESMRQAITEIDALLTDYARRHGGRFIRFGSTATGHMKSDSDVDIIADFAGALAGPAATYAEEICAERSLKCDPWPEYYVSKRLMERALAEGIVLS